MKQRRARRIGKVFPKRTAVRGWYGNLKATLDRLSRAYALALRNHLQGPGGSLLAALRMGRRAVILGLETLELARIHERALATLKILGAKDRKLKQAENFFTEALTPIVETHQAAKQHKLELSRLNELLTRRTAELATTNSHLQRGIRRRQRVERALEKSGIHYRKLLKESLRLQEGLRELTHRVLAAQEDERKKIGRELRDEIAQTLLGINVRLMTLKKEARANTSGLKNEIASTQRLVVRSARSVRRTAEGFRNV